VNVTASSQAYQSAERYSFEIRRDFSKYIHYPPPRLRTVFNCVPRKNVE
jgi:hypothetical protein